MNKSELMENINIGIDIISSNQDLLNRHKKLRRWFDYVKMMDSLIIEYKKD